MKECGKTTYDGSDYQVIDRLTIIVKQEKCANEKKQIYWILLCRNADVMLTFSSVEELENHLLVGKNRMLQRLSSMGVINSAYHQLASSNFDYKFIMFFEKGWALLTRKTGTLKEKPV